MFLLGVVRVLIFPHPHQHLVLFRFLIFVYLSVLSPGISLWIFFCISYYYYWDSAPFQVLLVLPFSPYKLPTSSLAIFLVRLFFSCSLSLLLPCSRTLSLTHWFIGVLYISWLLMLHQLYVLTNIFPSLCLRFLIFHMAYDEQKKVMEYE